MSDTDHLMLCQKKKREKSNALFHAKHKYNLEIHFLQLDRGGSKEVLNIILQSWAHITARQPTDCAGLQQSGLHQDNSLTFMSGNQKNPLLAHQERQFLSMTKDSKNHRKRDKQRKEYRKLIAMLCPYLSVSA